MQVVFTYRGRRVTEADVALIRELIHQNPGASRRALSRKLCEAWDWRQENGQLRDMVCRSLMLQLHRSGHIELPPVRQRSHNPLAHRSKPRLVLTDRSPLCCGLKQLGTLELLQVRRTGAEAEFNGLVEQYHYLGYTQPVGEQLKFMVTASGRPVACLSWSSAARHLGPRDRYIGWSAAVRRENIRYLAYNSRFLILPWVKVPHLASHLLGRMARELPLHWEQVYGHPVIYLETFVDRSRFAGTCYRAANWVYLGQTTGRGKDDHTHRANRPLKDVLGYPLVKDFRERLTRVG
ncbi:MAG: DUF4338 domain-containing protein [Acidobacteria bacterium]|nr:DUF4338 domain-containing protein [Acidobacteriota bacterium]